MPHGSQILAIDLAPIKPIPGVTCIMSDITTDKCRNIVRRELKGEKADVVLNDGAPNVGANWSKDAYNQCELTLQATRIACDHLKVGGVFVTKVFRSSDYNSLLWVFNQLFNKIDATKPTASRNVSAEIFVICKGFKGGNIDRKFFDPKWVFMEVVEPEAGTTMASGGNKLSLSEHLKTTKKRHRSGYEPGDDLKIVPASTFFEAQNPAEVLVTNHRIDLEASGCEAIAAHTLTNDEIRELCDDLKILGKRDLSALMKWRIKILRERERETRSKDKKEAAAAKEAGATGDSVNQSGKTKQGLAQDVDEAITSLLNEEESAAAAKKKAADDEDSSEVDEELEKDLAEQVAKRRREERRTSKKTMERQRKMEWKKKLSLGGGKEHEVADQPELFKVNKRNVEALEDEDKYIQPQNSDDEEENDDGVESHTDSSDDGLDRLARMEVDLAVNHELDKMRQEGKFRTQMQRQRKKKKETRRQRTLAAWSGELTAFNESLDRQNAAIHDQKEAEDNDESSGEGENLEELRQLQDALAGRGKSASTADGDALTALLDGGHPEKATRVAAGIASGVESDNSNEEEEDALGEGVEGPTRQQKALSAGKKADAVTSTALVPVEEDDDGDEEAMRSQRRASRWFSQDIFKSVSGKGDVASRDADGSDGGSSDNEEGGAKMREFEDEDLPQLPLSDKEKRRLKRKREQEKLERFGKKRKVNEEDKTPFEVAPLEPPKPLVPVGPQKPSDPRELAETLALGSLLVNSKKSRMELIDAAYNRWAFDRDETLPEWFTEEEEKHNKPELPITKEMMKQFRDKLREINARPIRKVLEAKGRKKRRLKLRLEKLRSTAMTLANNGEMSSLAKAKHMRQAVSKMARMEKAKVSVVAIKKGGGGNQTTKGKIPKGAKTKVVDRRMKSDRRAERRAIKKLPKGKANYQTKKKQQKAHKSKNRRVQDGQKKTRTNE
eukprot:TRINITY_DN67140_c0_g1_i1.p1 TRINITY_DN67140_c0_g1~~TRINITY_DN67140_c0_g1_i1.p1  ORF type:complete len:1042 (+),score=249.36 TRINITY_DN67140_c0_g1_i1:266-3127(+)